MSWKERQGGPWEMQVYRLALSEACKLIYLTMKLHVLL